jgi:hypothetical protein
VSGDAGFWKASAALFAQQERSAHPRELVDPRARFIGVHSSVLLDCFTFFADRESRSICVFRAK